MIDECRIDRLLPLLRERCQHDPTVVRIRDAVKVGAAL